MTVRRPSRSDLIARIRGKRAPVLIIGAGINGLGVFRDLSLQGVDCLIVDRGDFCAGTSAAPSRMIHGGLKYLETGDFRLVRESALERNRLLRNAPHLVHPLETVVPVPNVFGGLLGAVRRFLGCRARIRERGFAAIAAGLTLYDLLGRRERQMPRHRLLSGTKLRRLLPGIDRHFLGGATYYDAAITAPERLGLELALDAMADHPAGVALNHVAVVGHTAGKVSLRDGIDGTIWEVEPQIVVNAAGPWIDRVNAELGLATTRIGGAKGSHLILDKPDLLDRLDGRMVYFESQDGRICLVYPYLNRVLLGSTDIAVGDADAARCEADEVAYMLAALGKIFPDIDVAPDDIVYRYCGIRPLPRMAGTETGEVTRDHSIPVSEADRDRPFPVFDLVGGKWTTFRAFAEEAADAVLQRLDRPRLGGTRSLPIGGGAGFPDDRQRFARDLARRHALPAARAALLVRRYGTAAEAVARFCGERPDVPLAQATDYSRREIQYLAGQEMVERLGDLFYGRTSLAITGSVTAALVNEVSDIVGRSLGWSDARRSDEVSRFLADLADHHNIDLADAAAA
ncbi:MAG: glycerol-3-phosphate dehydrogenase/oxidase [Hyphomicrobiales bacterium]|nr:glycerol-3-phosphate dehydrogenase/oxidase [Hyphomicrobiales bacterium]